MPDLPRLIAANDFSAQWAEIGADAIAAVDRVGVSGRLILGDELEAFERELAAWWGIEHAVGVANGMDALEIALRCAGAGPGSRVLTTPLTAFATTLAILRAGATPVWCDVDESGLLDLDRAGAALSADAAIRFLLPVHLYGHPLDPHALADLRDRHGVTVIEDCAQSAGARRDGLPTGLAGLAAGLSLYPTKNLGALGDGGVLLTQDVEIAARARGLRNYGQTEPHQHHEPGLNSRLDELHAAILRTACLPRLSTWLKRRREVAARYTSGLADLGEELRAVGPSAGESAHHLFPIEVMSDRHDAIRRSLREQGVLVGRHYPRLCPDQPAASGHGVAVDSLSTARRIARREISLPINPQITDHDVERVLHACAEALK